MTDEKNLITGYIYKRTGETVWLHRKISGSGKSFVWYFNRDHNGAVELPADFDIIESPRSGYPLVKRRRIHG